MGKSTHFSGQPLYSQVIKLLDKAKILQISQEYEGERYIKRFDCWTHLKPIPLLTNDMESDPGEIIEIDRKRWEIELLFKQMKQNFPLKYFYGESANAIKIQIWITLIANLLLMVLKKRSDSFMELLRIGYNGQDNIDVLCGFL